ncbi:unnamed protein product, partial [Urochloa humidicola]
LSLSWQSREPATASAKGQGQVTAAPIGLIVGIRAWWGTADLNRREGRACATDRNRREGQAASCSICRPSMASICAYGAGVEEVTLSRGAIGSSEEAVLLPISAHGNLR